MTSFWGLICESGRRYKQKVSTQFHLTMAALDVKSQKNSKLASVFVENQGTEYLICNLNGEKNTQERLDLMFGEEEEVSFFVKGEGTVHLTGYEMPADDFELPDEYDEEFSDEEETTPVANGKRKLPEQQLANNKKVKTGDKKVESVIDIDATKLDKKQDKKQPAQPAKPQVNNKQAQAKKSIAQEDDDDLDIDSDIDSDELDKLIDQASDEDMDEEDDFDDDDDEDDDLEDAEDSEEEKLKLVQQKVKGKTNGQAGGKPNQPNKPQNQNKAPQQTPAKQQNKPQQTPNKQQQQQKGQNVQTPKNNQQGQQAKTPQTPKNNQNQNRQQTPFGKNNKQNQNSGKKESDGKPQPTGESSVKKLPNGLVIHDLVEGAGPEAKKGKYLHMNYVGKLTNNRVFDKTGNKPFAFRLGMGEVIKGWDQGIQGMKVGGKRRLTIPANLAYGKSGVGDIPPNATLVFDVELKGVN